MTGRPVGKTCWTSLVWLGGSGLVPRAGGEPVPLSRPSEHPFKDGTFSSNFGGSAIRYDKVPGILGMLESLDNPLPIGIAMRIEWAEPRAWRCSGSRSTWQIFPGGGCAKTDGSCWSKGERGRGLAMHHEEGPGAVLSHANGGVLPVGWAGKPWTRTPAATGQG